jgi:signal peptidase I
MLSRMPDPRRPAWPPPAPVKPATPARPSSLARRLLIGVSIAAGVAAATALVVAWAVIGPRLIRVEGHAMSPVLQNGDRAIFVRLWSPPGRGEVVALRYPLNPAKSFVMRIVGLPGERVSIAQGVVSIDGQALPEPYLVDANRSYDAMASRQLGPDEYFVLGDNRRNAADSREWGLVHRRHIWATMHAVILRQPATRR